MTSALREFATELRTDIMSGKATPALSTGLTSGLGLLATHIAFGTFIFSGPLAPYTSQGVGLVLFGSSSRSQAAIAARSPDCRRRS